MNALSCSARGPHTRPLWHLLAATLAALLLAACGGGDTSASSSGGNNNDGTSDAPRTTALTLAFPDIKTLRLTWADIGAETGYRVIVESGALVAPVVVADLPADTTQHDLQVFLPDQVNARYTLQACTPSGCIDVATATVETALLNGAVGYFKGTYRNIENGVSVDNMGRSVALSGDGSTLAVGAPNDDHAVGGGGAVHVFTRGPAGWARQVVITVPGLDTRSEFGESLALSGDGHRLVVGNSAHAEARGAIYLFDRNDGVWSWTLFQVDPYDPVPANAPQAPRFGSFVAISGDGSTVVAGRKRDDDTAVVIAQVNGQWVFQFTVPAHGPNDGSAYALSDDGNTLVVGRSGAFAAVQTPGVVDIYTRVDNVWQDTPVRLTASNAGIGDLFGWSVTIAGDGRTIAVGAPHEDGDSRENSGGVYVFVHSDNAWHSHATIKASNADAHDWFGNAVSLSDDGNALAVTAYAEDSLAQGLGGAQGDNRVPHSGAAYVFRRSAGTWRQTAYVKATNTGAHDQFGASVALSGNARSLAVGAVNESSAAIGIGGDQTDNSAGGSGAVYLY